MNDPRGDGVYEMPVVRHEENRALVGLERLFQNVTTGDVEVVGRLVQEQEVGRLQEHARQCDTIALTTGKDADLLLNVVPREEESAQNSTT